MSVSVINNQFLRSVRSQPNLPNGSWYVIAVAALAVLNRPDDLRTVYQHAVAYGHGAVDQAQDAEQKLSIARRMRESLVKSFVVTGAPKTINAMMALKEATPAECLDENDPSVPFLSGRRSGIFNTPTTEILKRGDAFFGQVYGKVLQRVLGQMENSGTEDLALMIRLLYGHVLSNVTILTPAETSCSLIAALLPQDVNPQLKGHLRGALNNGYTVEEVEAVQSVTEKICLAVGMKQLPPGSGSGWGWREPIVKL